MPDRHVLYQEAVQTPAADIAFLERVFRKGNAGRFPLSLREDFAGTALLAASWVASRPQRSAVAVDIDAATLAWAERHNRRPLGRAASRLRLLRRDAVSTVTPAADVVVALNFSYFCLKERETLVAYFRTALGSLQPGGVLVLDAFGGPEGMQVLEERRRVGGFTYCWEQEDFDPVSHSLLCHIHFELPRGRTLRRAFTYDWRLWSLPELADALRDAGFQRPDVYLETLDARGRGTGSFRLSRRSEALASFVAYVVASPALSRRSDRRTSARGRSGSPARRSRP